MTDPRPPRDTTLRLWIMGMALVAHAWVAPLQRGLPAQGVTSGVIRGSVVAADSSSVEGAQVRVVNTATGYAGRAVVRNGRFLVQGVDIGGPYRVTVTHIGFQPVQQAHLVLKLGEPLDLELVLQPQSFVLDTLTVDGAAGFSRVNAHGGTATTLSDSLVHHLPTLNRNFYDFMRFVPQISLNVGFQRSGVSAAGANFRFNSYSINGAEERFLSSNVPAAFANGKSIPIEAVKEYQALIAPYDARYGDFAGAQVNTVTNSGTNQLRGSSFALWRSDRLARADTIRSPYDRLQYGFALGGPIVRDRVHFFVASEFQRLVAPAPGPYLGQAVNVTPHVPVKAGDIARLDTLMRRYDLISGSGGRVELANPVRNLFARLDAALPQWRSRASAFLTYYSGEGEQFTRSANGEFPLSTYKALSSASLRLISIQLQSQLSRRSGAHNELSLSHSADRNDSWSDVRQPLVKVRVSTTSDTGSVWLKTGTVESQGRFGRAWSVKVRDDASVPLGADHVLRLGAQVERFHNTRGGVLNSYGTWEFASLDAFARGEAMRYELRKDMLDTIPSLSGSQYAAWIGDEWRASPRLSVTMGVRADLLELNERAPYEPLVDSIFGRRTDEMPRARVHVSPRVGFTWSPTAAATEQLRGGAGLFTMRPLLGWMIPALSSYGFGIGELRCAARPGDRAPPHFEPDYTRAPTACANGYPISAGGPVNLLDRNLGMAQTLRASLAYDRRLPGDIQITGEVLVSRHVSDFIWVNLNLVGPQAVDRFGRVLYGTFEASGLAVPALRDTAKRFSEVIDLTNTSKNYSYQLSARVERRFAHGLSALASYTYSRTRDVQSLSRINSAGLALWADARAVSGRHDQLKDEVSLNDLPHRAVAAFTYRVPWQRLTTSVALYYVGESGSPFTYLAQGGSGLGDLNADGSNANDPIYVPRNAADANEIRFSGSAQEAGAQQAAFERFIDKSQCLRKQRGHIVERNSCRDPWSHMSIASLRQTIPVGDRAVEVGLDLFNVLNLLNRGWGDRRVAALPSLLKHVGQATDAAGSTQPVFRLCPDLACGTAAVDSPHEWRSLETESLFQLQLALRYRF